MQPFFQSLKRNSALIPALSILASIPVLASPAHAVIPSKKLKSGRFSTQAEIARQAEEIRQLHAEIKALAMKLDTRIMPRQQKQPHWHRRKYRQAAHLLPQGRRLTKKQSRQMPS